jgi:hypothetical protein
MKIQGFASAIHSTVQHVRAHAEKYDKLTTEPYEEVFAQIIGKQLGNSTDGFAMDYDDQIQVIELILMKKKSDTDCQ